MSATKRAKAKTRLAVVESPQVANGRPVVDVVNLAMQLLQAAGWKGTLTIN